MDKETERDDLIFKAIDQFKLDIRDGEYHPIYELLKAVDPKILNKQKLIIVNIYSKKYLIIFISKLLSL